MASDDIGWCQQMFANDTDADVVFASTTDAGDLLGVVLDVPERQNVVSAKTGAKESQEKPC